MYSVFALLLLIAAFAILVVTFLWVARLLGLIGKDPVSAESDDGEEEEGQEDPVEGEGEVEADSDVDAEEEESGRGRAVILGANHGLVLGVLAVILFKVSWLMLMLSAGAIGYSSRALYQGIRHYRLIVYRALIGFLLGLLSVGLQYLEFTGQLAEMVPLLGGKIARNGPGYHR